MKSKRLAGIGVSSGIVKGRAYLFRQTIQMPLKRMIKKEEIEKERLILRYAREKTKQEISNTIKKTDADFGANFSQIFDIHLALLEDPMLFSVSEKNIERGMNASYAFHEAIKAIIDNLSLHSTQVGRTIEILHDISRKIFYYLGEMDYKGVDIDENVILVAKNLTPYDTISISKDKVIGILCSTGTQTSHAAIFARGLRIPAVFGVGEIEGLISQDDILILDGKKGLVIINPGKNDEKLYERRKKEEELESYFKNGLVHLPPKTKDGHRINLTANIEFLDEAYLIKKENLDGIGLLRTEFLFLESLGIPDEDCQFKVYSEISGIAYPHYVTIRIFDIDEEKMGLFFKEKIEFPSFLKGIRLLLKYKDILKTQLRAILRANKRGNLKIMFPMVTCREELNKAISILSEVKDELKKEKIEFEEDIEIGTMIETPSAAIACDTLTEFVDFFSIGTNDLIKYTLVVDRTNPDIACFYEPLDPSILRLIKNIVDVGRKARISVGMCGEMASEPLYTPLLLGLGIDELSVNLDVANRIRKAIRSITQDEAEKIKDIVFSLKTAREIREFLEKEAIKWN